MNDRKRLIELQKTNCVRGKKCCEDCLKCMADHLIANGVVVQKQGEWSHCAGGRSICNHCGEYPLYDYFGRQKFSNYCPHCGAKME